MIINHIKPRRIYYARSQGINRRKKSVKKYSFAVKTLVAVCGIALCLMCVFLLPLWGTDLLVSTVNAMMYYELSNAFGFLKNYNISIVGFLASCVYPWLFYFGAVSNALSVAGMFKFDKSKVRLNDGKFEVMLVRKITGASGFFSMLKKMIKGEYDGDSLISLTSSDIKFTFDSESTVRSTANSAEIYARRI